MLRIADPTYKSLNIEFFDIWTFNSLVRLPSPKLTWTNVPGATGYNIRWGIAPDKLYQTYQFWHDEPGTFELRALNVGVPYYFAIEAFNETGVSGQITPLENHAILVSSVEPSASFTSEFTSEPALKGGEPSLTGCEFIGRLALI